ncbi:AAA family ATPase [Rudaea sp.]|uniref:AAA family ATPase n=1 Tax=Rudaea sp. TaxID=2136325 RepID=UPI0037848D1E
MSVAVYEMPTRKPVSIDGVILLAADTVKPEPIRWLWPGWLARGKLHVLAGQPGTGKTTLAMDIAASVSAGRALPSGWRPDHGRVLVWTGEDDPRDTLVPRLIAAGADLSRIQFVDGVRHGGEIFPFDPARDVTSLAAAVAETEGVALIVIDPLVSAVPGDSHKNAEVRRGLQPLVDLAIRLDAALVGITHYSKGTNGREPLERVSGSLAFGALARVVLGTVKQQSEDDTDKRMLLARAKSNIGPDGGGYGYAFEQVEVAGHPGLFSSRIVWGAAVEGTARELLTEAEPSIDPGTDAADFLRGLLEEGSMQARAVFAEASAAGYSRDSMQRAKRKIGAVAVKIGMKDGWAWKLPRPEDGAEGSEGSAQKRPPSSPPSGGNPPPSAAVVEEFDL